MVRPKKQDFKKSNRFRGLKKKIEELTILCDVDAFLLFFEHGIDSSASSSYSWPEDHNTCLSLITKYKNSLKQQKKKIQNPQDLPLEDFEIRNLLRSEDVAFDELNEIIRGIDKKQKVVDERIEHLKRSQGLKEEKIKKEEEMRMMGCDGSCGLLNCILVESRVLAQKSRSLHLPDEEANREKGKEVDYGHFLGFPDYDQGFMGFENDFMNVDGFFSDRGLLGADLGLN